MTIDTIAARNRRIKELKAERDEWRELALANEGRAQAAEARESELRQIVGRLATALIAGGVPREDVEVVTGAAFRSPEPQPAAEPTEEAE